MVGPSEKQTRCVCVSVYHSCRWNREGAEAHLSTLRDLCSGKWRHWEFEKEGAKNEKWHAAAVNYDTEHLLVRETFTSCSKSEGGGEEDGTPEENFVALPLVGSLSLVERGLFCCVQQTLLDCWGTNVMAFLRSYCHWPSLYLHIRPRTTVFVTLASHNQEQGSKVATCPVRVPWKKTC
jgi:hypothetical protein